jgi:multisite-specific tRNA:(cytosine-C5)-methyltransferase
VPQDQNTGGFFVCVLEKASDAVIEEPSEALPEIPPLVDVAVADETGSSRLKRAATPTGIEGQELETKRSKSDAAETEMQIEAVADPEEAMTNGVEVQSKPKQQKNAGSSKKKEKRDLSFREDPYSYVRADHEEVDKIV